ncbi:MAG: aldo/keto reductase [Schaedlerella sp.]|uniref:aldo/keto reductase n=1 Tax=Schaedlerella sp. TaxID=2676057 RepID=UPI00265EE864|nr:aldo/keto reductase [uncultured Schaedlerella sp.]
MQYKKFKSSAKLSILGMGAMRLPVVGGDQGNIDYEKAKAIIDRAYQGGVNYYDTAYIYHNGKSEEFLGKALAEYPRESYYVADKFNLQAEPDYKKQFPEQLSRLNMEYIDFYLIHGIQDAWMDQFLECGALRYFDELKKQGKIRNLGFSFHASPDSLRKLLKIYPWDFVQIQLNYLDWYYGDAKELYEILEEAEIPIMIMEPVRGGKLANLTPEAEAILKEADPEASIASWALRFVMSRPQVQVVLSGMSNLEQMEDNLHIFSETACLTEEEEALVKKAADEFRSKVGVGCTACRYCTPNCPIGLDIPKILSLYNDVKLVNEEWRATFADAMPEGKRPEDCIGCGACTGHCPQSLDVPAVMKEMAEIRKKFQKEQ